MIKFTYKGKALAYMSIIGATIRQIEAARQVVAKLFGHDLGSIVIKSQFDASIFRF